MLDINWLLYCSYLATISAIIITLGPNSQLMVQQSIVYGKKASLFNALGSATVALLLMLISSIGLQILLTPHILQFLSIIGAIYLMYLGISTIKHSKNFTAHDPLQPSQVTGFKFFKDAFLVGVSNPKDILFFLLFMPQFLDKNISFSAPSILLIIGWVVCDLVIMSLYALLASKIQKISQHNLQRISHVSDGIITLIGTSILIKTII